MYDTLRLFNQAQCDSIVFLTLEVLCINNTEEIFDTIFVGESYNEYGFSLPVQNATGTILETLHLHNQYACDSTVILNLEIQCALSDTTEIIDAISVGENYNENGFTIPAQTGAGTVFDTLHLNNQYACDSIVILQLEVQCVNQSSAITDSIFVGESYNKYGFVIPVQNSETILSETLNLRTQYDCDSTVTLDLKVKCIFDTTYINESIFVGEGYNENGFTIPVQTAPSTISQTLTVASRYACDSTIMLTLSVFPVVQQTICASELPFTFGGTTFAPGTASGTYIIDEGLSSMTKLELTINQTPPAPVVIIEKSQICDYDEEPKINAIVTGGGTATITWYTSANETDELPLFAGQTEITANRNISKQYYARQEIDGCRSDFSGESYAVADPVPAPTTIGAAMCENDISIPALRVLASNVKWYTTEVLLPAKPTETPLATGRDFTPAGITATSTFYVQNEVNDCLSPMAAATMTVTEMPVIAIGSDVDFCENDEKKVPAQHLLPAMNPSSYIDWQLSNSTGFSKILNSESANGEHFTRLNSDVVPNVGNYVLTAIYKVGNCASNPQSIAVRMHNRPAPPIAASKIVCQGEELEPLQAFGTALIMWKFQSGVQNLSDWVGETYNFNQLNLNEIPEGQYTFKLFSNDVITGCLSDSTDLTFEIAPAAQTKIIGNTQLCAGTSLEEMYSIQSTPLQKSNYYWSTSGNIYNYSKDGNPHSPARYIDWNKPGIDTVYVRESTWAACEGFDTLVVNIAPYPVAYYNWTLPGAGTTIEFMDSSFQAPIVSAYDASVEPIELSYSMAWHFDLIPTLNKQHVDWVAQYDERFIPVTAENYTYGYKYPVLTVTNQYGCANSYSTEVFIDIQAGVHIPNAFSPGNSAEAVRVFKPVAFNLEYCKLWIYDKWGNLLYFSDEVVDGMFAGEWNGTYNGELMQSDVYIWKMDAKFLDGTTWKGSKKPAGGFTKFGNVTLVRYSKTVHSIILNATFFSLVLFQKECELLVCQAHPNYS